MTPPDGQAWTRGTNRQSAMALIDLDMSGGEALGREQCLALLRTASVGRVGLTSGALPIVVPIDYRVWHDQIVFRTEAGSRLDAAARGAVVAFEVDALGPTYPWGWSVMVTGLTADVTDSAAEAETDFAPTGWWMAGVEQRLLALSTDVMAGCRLERQP